MKHLNKNLKRKGKIHMSEEKALMAREEFFGGKEDQIYTSIDISTIDGKIMTQNCLSDSDYNLDDMKEKAYPIEHVLAHYVNINSDRGSIQAIRTVLVTADGETISFTSDGVIASLKRIFGLMGEPPWRPPLWMKAKEVRTRNGYRTINLMVVKPPEDKDAKQTIDV